MRLRISQIPGLPPVRLIRRNPGLAVLVIAVLGVGIGACTTVFSILNTLFYRPLRYPHAERLVMMGRAYTRGQQVGPMAPVSYYEYDHWRSRAQSFEYIVAYRREPFIITAARGPERVRGETVAPGYFEMLGTPPLLGRGFISGEYRPGAAPVLVLSEEYWRRALNARPDVLGMTLRVDGSPATVVGVMPGKLRATLIEGGPRAWRPLIPPAEVQFGSATLSVLGRLKPGVALASARAETAVIGKRLAAEHPDPDHDPAVRVDGLQETLAQAASAPIAKVLVMAVTFLLLISCVNVANLLLGRAAGRQKEIALRLAMGAGRGRLIRQFLSECLGLAILGGLAGAGLAVFATAWCSNTMGPLLANDGIEQFVIDGRVLGFGLLASVAAAVLFGTLPALRGSRVNVSDSLKECGTGYSVGGARQRLSRLLVVVEVTLSVVLVSSAGLLLNSIMQYWRFDWGIPLDHRLAMQVAPLEQVDDTDAKRIRFYTQLLSRAQELPGVESAALVNAMPFHLGASTAKISADGAQHVQAGYRIISSGYHATAGLPLRAGRVFSETDTANSLPVALVSESLTAKLWPGKDSIGERVLINGTWRTVVGITRDVTQDLARLPKHEVCVPYTQARSNIIRVLLRVSADPATAGAALRQAVHAFNPDLPLGEPQTLLAARKQIGAPYEFVMGLLCSFAVAALLLAGAGLYGITSRAVAIRRREIGIRMALGADVGMVLRYVLRGALALVLTGTLLGSALALVVIKLLITRLWWVSSVPVFFWVAPVALVMAVLAIISSLVPARRAARIDPSLSLKAE